MPAEIFGARSPIVRTYWETNLEYKRVAIRVQNGALQSNATSNVSNAQYELKIPAIDFKSEINLSPYIKPFIDTRDFTSDRFYFVYIWTKTKLTTGTEDLSWTYDTTIIAGNGYNYSYQQDVGGPISLGLEQGFKSINAGDSPNDSTSTSVTNDGVVHNTDKYMLTDAPYFVVPKTGAMIVAVRFDDNASEKVYLTNYINSWNATGNVPAGSIAGTGPVVGDLFHSHSNYDALPTGRYNASADSSTGIVASLVFSSSAADWVAVTRTDSVNKVWDIIQTDYDDDGTTGAQGDTGDQVPAVNSFLDGPVEVRRVDTCDDSGVGKRWSKITFVNKYGALQEFYFFGNMVIDTNVKRDKFNQSNKIGDDSRTYRATIGTKIKDATRRYTINTGRHYDERYNEVFTQIMLSEQIWLTDNRESVTAGVIPFAKPVRLISSDWKYNTDHFKLRDYQFVFEDAEEYLDLNV